MLRYLLIACPVKCLPCGISAVRRDPIRGIPQGGRISPGLMVMRKCVAVEVTTMIKEYKTYYHSEIGLMEIVGTENGIVSVGFVEEKSMHDSGIQPCLEECIEQIDEYFRGKRREFSLDLQLHGTDFQKRVWSQLMKIPFGETASYKDIAASIGNEKAVRAVGNANGKNRISIIIPCHRVIGSNGKLIGYASGVWRKEWLLLHERKVCSIKRL
jgi:methylated-DNA-[protein]-cysteine S-methyltransferase